MSKLVKHVRDFWNVPVATIVALSPNMIGVSICNKKDHFNRHRGTVIAEGRARYALLDEMKIPNRSIPTRHPNGTGCGTFFLEDIITQEVENMKVRATKYFKES